MSTRTPITQGEIERGLRALGLTAGDLVLLHSSLASLGQVEDGADAVIDAFLAVLGPMGTLVVPTFGALGAIPDRVKARPGVIHSIHPMASVAALGGRAAELCRDHWKPDVAHAEGTPYLRLAENNGYVCLLGVDQDRNTTLHTAEELLRLAYLKPTAARSFDTPEGPVTKHWEHFPGPHRDFIGLDRALRQSGKLRLGRIGSAVARLIRSRDLIEVALAAGRQDPAFVLCHNPNCADCVSQRAALRRARLASEAFTLASSSGLAGRYVPEMVDTYRAAGVDNVELDLVDGRPVAALKLERITGAVAELRAAGLRVEALRLLPVSEAGFGLLLDAAEAAAVGRLVVPLWLDPAAMLRRASERGVRLSFSAGPVGSVAVSQALLELRDAGLEFGFTFNGADFARGGEKPFLYSYKQKLRRFVDQLDLEEVTFDGLSQPLGAGNSETKEMISVLRCASFSGPMVLGLRNRHCGGLAQATDRFLALLESM